MASLVVRNLDKCIIDALKKRAAEEGISAEAEHRKILEKFLINPQRKSFAQILTEIPNVGTDDDFQRIDIGVDNNVFT
jgi:antitoxin FitA